MESYSSGAKKERSCSSKVCSSCLINVVRLVQIADVRYSFQSDTLFLCWIATVMCGIAYLPQLTISLSFSLSKIIESLLHPVRMPDCWSSRCFGDLSCGCTLSVLHESLHYSLTAALFQNAWLGGAAVLVTLCI